MSSCHPSPVRPVTGALSGCSTLGVHIPAQGGQARLAGPGLTVGRKTPHSTADSEAWGWPFGLRTPDHMGLASWFGTSGDKSQSGRGQRDGPEAPAQDTAHLCPQILTRGQSSITAYVTAPSDPRAGFTGHCLPAWILQNCQCAGTWKQICHKRHLESGMESRLQQKLTRGLKCKASHWDGWDLICAATLALHVAVSGLGFLVRIVI